MAPVMAAAGIVELIDQAVEPTRHFHQGWVAVLLTQVVRQFLVIEIAQQRRLGGRLRFSGRVEGDLIQP